MTIPSPALIARLKQSEGFRATPYLCPAGRVTIGYGWNLEANPEPLAKHGNSLVAQIQSGRLKGDGLKLELERIGLSWTRAEAEERLLDAIRHIVARLEALSPVFADLAAKKDPPSLARAEVLVDMAYNMGVHGLLQFRNMFAALDKGDYLQAATEMLDSAWATQVRTRSMELARIMRAGG